MAFVPLAAGNYTIPPATLVVQVQESSPYDDDFPSFVFRSGRPYSLTTKPLAIKVLPLPEERPKDFTGAVGRFTMAASVDRDQVKAGEPITLTVELKGAGNIKTITAPAIPEMADVKQYDTTSSESIEKSDYRITGKKIFQTMIVPFSQGALTIPSIGCSYFDPTEKRYVSLSTAPLTVTVLPGTAANVPPQQSQAGEGAEVKLKGRDIRYLKTSPGMLRPAATLLYRNPAFLALLPIPLGVFLVFLGLERAKHRRERDPSGARKIQAPGKARKILSAVNESLAKGDLPGGFGLLAKGLTEFIADRFDVPAGSLTLAEIQGTLVDKGVGDDIAASVKEHLSEWDFARFASARFGAEDLRQAAREYSRLLSNLERVGKS
jgi:hypothetical protein